ncbi:MAG: ATP-dependent metalloprotease FtsH [Gemmatimonadetes bacterium]|nr:ATP-dependent metalloprotease FtsH [Gemmatimonadota bacterium]
MPLPLPEKPIVSTEPLLRPEREERPRRDGKKPRVSRRAQQWLVGVTAAVLVGLILFLHFKRDDEPRSELAYSELLAALPAHRVQSLVVQPGTEVRGWWKGHDARAGAPADFRVAYPVQEVDGLAQRAEAAGVRVTLEPAPDPRGLQDRLTLAVLLGTLGVVVWFVIRHIRSQAGGELGGNAGSDTTFKDVAGTQGAAEELRELVEFLRSPEAFDAVGARIPKGALLVGPPGTGKTLLARAVAGEAGVSFYSVSGSEVTGFLVGMGAHRIRSLFRRARKTGGVVFIDEIDVLGGKRGRNRSHNEDDRTLNQFLVEMDGFSPLDGVVVVAATNRPEDLDEALKRPGRFDRIIQVAAPNADGREEILRLHAGRRRIPMAADVELGRLARLTPGATGAELANLLNESAIAAAREGSKSVHWAHVEQARDRLLLGKERTGFRALDLERCIVAYHEAGHALAGVVCCPEDGLHKVTIQARGQALGVAFFSPDDDRSLYRRSYMEGQIMKGLAGRAAEELVFGADHVTSGAQSDLQHVNGIARKMVYHLGMGIDTGLLVHEGEVGSLSQEAHARMDREVQRILTDLYERTRDLLDGNRESLAALAVALMEHETLDGAEAMRVMEEAGLVSPGQLAPGRPTLPLPPLAVVEGRALSALRTHKAEPPRG